jgi:AcrR family transcriptional regulator
MMASMEPAAQAEPDQAEERRPGRPGDAGPTPAILLATLQVIADEGFAGFSVDKVAAAAGVGKATIYRRWPSKEDLIHEAFGQVVNDLPEPDTGSLRGDILAFTRGLLDQIEAQPALLKVYPALVAESAWDPRLLEVLGQVNEKRTACGYPVVQRAKARGELPQDVPDALPLDLSSGWIYWRMTMVQQMPTDDELVQMVDSILQGVCGPARA